MIWTDRAGGLTRSNRSHIGLLSSLSLSACAGDLLGCCVAPRGILLSSTHPAPLSRPFFLSASAMRVRCGLLVTAIRNSHCVVYFAKSPGVGECEFDWDLIISRCLRLFSAGRNKFAHTSSFSAWSQCHNLSASRWHEQVLADLSNVYFPIYSVFRISRLRGCGGFVRVDPSNMLLRFVVVYPQSCFGYVRTLREIS